MSRALFLLSLKDELFATTEYYKQVRAGLGLRFVDAVEAAVSRALALPDGGRPTIKGARRVTECCSRIACVLVDTIVLTRAAY